VSDSANRGEYFGTEQSGKQLAQDSGSAAVPGDVPAPVPACRAPRPSVSGSVHPAVRRGKAAGRPTVWTRPGDVLHFMVSAGAKRPVFSLRRRRPHGNVLDAGPAARKRQPTGGG